MDKKKKSLFKPSTFRKNKKVGPRRKNCVKVFVVCKVMPEQYRSDGDYVDSYSFAFKTWSQAYKFQWSKEGSKDNWKEGNIEEILVSRDFLK